MGLGGGVGIRDPKNAVQKVHIIFKTPSLGGWSYCILLSLLPLLLFKFSEIFPSSSEFVLLWLPSVLSLFVSRIGSGRSENQKPNLINQTCF